MKSPAVISVGFAAMKYCYMMGKSLHGYLTVSCFLRFKIDAPLASNLSKTATSFLHLHSAPLLSAGGVEPRTKFSKKGGLTEP